MKTFNFLGYTIMIIRAEKNPEEVIKLIVGREDIRCTREDMRANARHIVIWWLKEYKGYSNSAAANFLGLHQANHSRKVVNNFIETKNKIYYPIIQEFLKQMEKK